VLRNYSYAFHTILYKKIDCDCLKTSRDSTALIIKEYRLLKYNLVMY